MRNYISPRKPIWTPRSDATPHFIPLTEAFAATDWFHFLWWLEWGEPTGDLVVVPALQLSNDAQSWTTTVDLDSSFTTINATAGPGSTNRGRLYATQSYSATSFQAKDSHQHVRAGVNVKNATGESGTEFARVRIGLQGVF